MNCRKGISMKKENKKCNNKKIDKFKSLSMENSDFSEAFVVEKDVKSHIEIELFYDSSINGEYDEY